jgi:2Fe-2S ferredoxin
MPTLTFIDQRGETRVLDSAVGASVMEIAVQNGIAGIAAECGGACSCATCHVYVEQGFDDFLPPADAENELLEYTAAERQLHSRLGCQLKIGAEHDGVVIRIPDAQ